MLTVCTHLYQAVYVHAIWYQTFLLSESRNWKRKLPFVPCPIWNYTVLYSAHTIQCILHCAVYRAGNTVKCADCIVFSHGRTVVNRDCHKSRHSSLVDRGLRGAGLMITLAKGWYHRAYLGPKSMVPRSEISLPMHYCYKSRKENNKSPQSSSYWLWYITLGRLAVLVCLKQERIVGKNGYFRAKANLKTQSYIMNNIPPVIGILDLLLVSDQ